MRRSHGRQFLAMLTLGALSWWMLAACSTGRPPVPAVAPQPAATPREALITAYAALVAGDEARLLSVCRANSKQREALAALARMTAVANEFHRAMVAAYGNEGWEDLGRKKEPVPNGPVTGSFQMGFIAEKQIAQLENAPIDERGSEAFCLALHPGPTPEEKAKEAQAGDKKRKEPLKVRMVKDKSGWLVDGGTLTPGMGASEIAMLEMFTSLMRKHQPQIGQPGVTPDQISREMAGDFLAMALSGKLR